MKIEHSPRHEFSTSDSNPDLAITIMADIGMAPYAWIKPATDTSRYVGLNCGGYMHKPEEFVITDELHDRFVAWASNFEAECDSDSFNWDMFNKTGIDLAGQLKNQVGTDFTVFYARATGDPDSETEANFEVLQ